MYSFKGYKVSMNGNTFYPRNMHGSVVLGSKSNNQTCETLQTLECFIPTSDRRGSS